MILWGAVWDFLSQRAWAFHGSFQKSLTIVHHGRRLTVWNVCHNCKPSTQMCQSKLNKWPFRFAYTIYSFIRLQSIWWRTFNHHWGWIWKNISGIAALRPF
jgi:hypothetical protein